MKIIGAIMGCVILVQPAMAQQSDFRSGGLVRNEASLGLGLTIPLGARHHEEPPRIELRMTRDVRNADGSRLSTLSTYQAETRIGFDLTPNHQVRINGRAVEQDRRQGVSTIGWVAIGLGVALIGGLALLADDVSDASE